MEVTPTFRKAGRDEKLVLKCTEEAVRVALRSKKLEHFEENKQVFVQTCTTFQNGRKSIPPWVFKMGGIKVS